MKTLLRPIGCIVFFVLIAPPLGMSIFFLYGLVALPKLFSHRIDFPWRDFFGAIYEFAPLTLFAGFIFITLTFAIPFIRQRIQNRFVCLIVAAFSLSFPFLWWDIVAKIIQGYRVGQYWQFFLVMSLSVGAILGIIFPKKFLPIAKLN